MLRWIARSTLIWRNAGVAGVNILFALSSMLYFISLWFDSRLCHLMMGKPKGASPKALHYNLTRLDVRKSLWRNKLDSLVYNLTVITCAGCFKIKAQPMDIPSAVIGKTTSQKCREFSVAGSSPPGQILPISLRSLVEERLGNHIPAHARQSACASRCAAAYKENAELFNWTSLVRSPHERSCS
ncbi:hypothetical protein PoB_000336000 [Plakobranchus ocellatus]|uniref:Uncharacterized protein n=1 Tax=Plakobranchus ocellatus TaxID=259542 RepID=A0AAV3Y2I9_9GAST|nr:hypothetical protein PoB_000336000 [Plakobranchus ocellatus]